MHENPGASAAESRTHDETQQFALRFALRHATLAPSSHNSQPWRFVLGADRVLLCADRLRALPVVDPYDRELVISCGAALFNLRVALASLGIGTRSRCSRRAPTPICSPRCACCTAARSVRSLRRS